MPVEPIVSIIVPVYNAQRHLRPCIESILAQEPADAFELIVVDDGSSDGSPAICDEFARRDPRVTVIHQENQGVSAARNAGIEHASGAYLMFVDADDVVRDGFVSKPLSWAREHDADIVVFELDATDEEGRILPERMQRYRMGCSGLFGRVDALCALARHDIYDFAWNKLYRREVFEGVRFPVGQRWEDMTVSYRLIDRAERVFVSDEHLYLYRTTEGAISREAPYVSSDIVCGHLYDAIAYLEQRCPEAACLLADRSIEEEATFLRTHCSEGGSERFEEIKQRFLAHPEPFAVPGVRIKLERAVLALVPWAFPVMERTIGVLARAKRSAQGRSLR